MQCSRSALRCFIWNGKKVARRFPRGKYEIECNRWVQNCENWNSDDVCTNTNI